MKTPSWYIPRRTLLQTAGTAIGLPVLEAMIKPGARAALAPPPRRWVSIHGQVYGFVGRDDGSMNTKVAPWGTAKPGANMSFPLEKNTHMSFFFDKKVDAKVTILTGLTERVLWGTH